MNSLDMKNNNLLKVGQQDLVHYPQLAQALSDVNRLVSDVGSMDKREQSELLDQLEKFLPTLAAHPRGYKVVVEMVCQFKESLLDRVVRILSRNFIPLRGSSWCQVPAGQPHPPAQGAAAELDQRIFLPH